MFGMRRREFITLLGGVPDRQPSLLDKARVLHRPSDCCQTMAPQGQRLGDLANER